VRARSKKGKVARRQVEVVAEEWKVW